MSKTILHKPFKGNYKCTSDYGPRDLNGNGRIDPGALENHKGFDAALPVGTPLYAIEDGLVASAGAIDQGHLFWVGGRQPFIKNGPNQAVSIRSAADGNFATYMHMSRIDVKAGQKVKAGQQIGLSGNSGASYAAHLHFELTTGSRPFMDSFNYKLAGINAVYPNIITFPGNDEYTWVDPGTSAGASKSAEQPKPQAKGKGALFTNKQYGEMVALGYKWDADTLNDWFNKGHITHIPTGSYIDRIKEGYTAKKQVESLQKEVNELKEKLEQGGQVSSKPDYTEIKKRTAEFNNFIQGL